VFAAVPPLRILAEKLGFVDKPTDRKNHKTPTPLIGGVAMFIGFAAAYIIFIGVEEFKNIAVLVAAALILCIGIVDDYYKTKGREFRVLPRALIHLASATLVFASGIRFEGFMNPFNERYVFLSSFAAQYISTVVWIFGVTTVINWMDGLDGLAGGLAVISGATMFVCALYKDQPDSAIMAIIMIGAASAFLRYNKYPAKIFMGDSGANFLGFILAVIALHGAFKQATVVSVFVPVLALGLPIFDNIFLVIKRLVQKRPIYAADAGQIHHRLLKRGLSPSQVVIFLFLVSVCLNLTSIIIMLI